MRVMRPLGPQAPQQAQGRVEHRPDVPVTDDMAGLPYRQEFQSAEVRPGRARPRSQDRREDAETAPVSQPPSLERGPGRDADGNGEAEVMAPVWTGYAPPSRGFPERG